MASAVQTEGQLLSAISIAERTQRYGDVYVYTKLLCSRAYPYLNKNLRHALNFAYKAVLDPLRKAMRTIDIVIKTDKHTSGASCEKVGFGVEYQSKLQGEIEILCNEAEDYIETLLLALTADADEKPTEIDIIAFYHKLLGDIGRYVLESRKYCGLPWEDWSTKTRSNYEKASNLLRDSDPWSYVRMGTALNFSVFEWELCDDIEKARSIALQAFEECTQNWKENLPEEGSDLITLLSMLRDNLFLWYDEDTITESR